MAAIVLQIEDNIRFLVNWLSYINQFHVTHSPVYIISDSFDMETLTKNETVSAFMSHTSLTLTTNLAEALARISEPFVLLNPIHVFPCIDVLQQSAAWMDANATFILARGIEITTFRQDIGISHQLAHTLHIDSDSPIERVVDYMQLPFVTDHALFRHTHLLKRHQALQGLRSSILYDYLAGIYDCLHGKIKELNHFSGIELKYNTPTKGFDGSLFDKIFTHDRDFIRMRETLEQWFQPYFSEARLLANDVIGAGLASLFGYAVFKVNDFYTPKVAVKQAPMAQTALFNKTFSSQDFAKGFMTKLNYLETLLEE